MFVCFLYPQKKWNLGKKLNQFNHGHERKSSLFLKFIQFVWSDFWSSTRDRTYSQMYTYVYRIIYTLDICVFKHSHLNILVFSGMGCQLVNLFSTMSSVCRYKWCNSCKYLRSEVTNLTNNHFHKMFSLDDSPPHASVH